MPTYVYKNLDTGEKFELVQNMTEPALKHHPETGAPVRRVIQPVGIAFKGSGFYVTDSRTESKKVKEVKKKDTSKESSSSKESTENKLTTSVENKSSTKSNSESKPKEKASQKSSE